MASGQNFCASLQLKTIAAPLEAEFQQYSQIKEGSFKLQHNLAAVEITGRMLTVSTRRKHGTDLKYCNMPKMIRYFILYVTTYLFQSFQSFSQYFLQIKLNGRVVKNVENRNPKTYNNVKVWTAKAKYGFPASDAYIKDLEYENLGLLKK